MILLDSMRHLELYVFHSSDLYSKSGFVEYVCLRDSTIQCIWCVGLHTIHYILARQWHSTSPVPCNTLCQRNQAVNAAHILEMTLMHSWSIKMHSNHWKSLTIMSVNQLRTLYWKENQAFHSIGLNVYMHMNGMVWCVSAYWLLLEGGSHLTRCFRSTACEQHFTVREIIELSSLLAKKLLSMRYIVT